jgi:hypothetical protein
MSTAGEVVDLSERVRHLEAVETIQIGDGAPTHFAAEGERYWDRDNDALYVNNDGANGWTLIGGGAAGAVPHNILSATHSDSTAATVSRGSIITGQDDAGTTTWQELGLGAGNSVLMSDGVDASWQIPGTWWSGGWMPLGGIILWSGSVATIPPNWQLCDGTNGTPNLRDRFVVGAGTSYAVDATGGAVSQDLTHTHGPGSLDTDNDTHDHSVDAGVTGAGSAHSHGPGTLGTDTHVHQHALSGRTGVSDASYEPVEAGAVSVPDTAHTHGIGTIVGAQDSHDHDVDAGTTASAHTHGPGTLDTDNDTHDHSVNAGVTGGALGVTSILPPYYALAYIMRMS